ncbi:hypothetical protein [Rhizobium sp. HT1-10]|uniref:hypothetical protein n=1 Tax=Rhizobium sp. HT1-10 TaxID=3111638 RepID=UPI003C1AE43D
MIKLVVTGLWVCAVTLVAVYFSVQMATAPAASPEPKPPEEEFVKGESINVPIIGDTGVTGYFITKISYMMDKAKAKDEATPLPALTTDALFTLLVGDKMIDMSKPKAFNLEAFRGEIKKNMNEHLGGDYVKSVVIEQLDYLSKDEVRASESAPAKRNIKTVPLVPPEAAPTAAEQTPAKTH